MFVLYLQTTTETMIFYITIYMCVCVCVCIDMYIHAHKHERINSGCTLALLVPSREDFFYLESEKLVSMRFFSGSHRVCSWPLHLRLLLPGIVGPDSLEGSSWCLPT